LIYGECQKGGWEEVHTIVTLLEHETGERGRKVVKGLRKHPGVKLKVVRERGRDQQRGPILWNYFEGK
jgi:hypothetical protein